MHKETNEQVATASINAGFAHFVAHVLEAAGIIGIPCTEYEKVSRLAVAALREQGRQEAQESREALAVPITQAASALPPAENANGPKFTEEVRQRCGRELENLCKEYRQTLQRLTAQCGELEYVKGIFREYLDTCTYCTMVGEVRQDCPYCHGYNIVSLVPLYKSNEEMFQRMWAELAQKDEEIAALRERLRARHLQACDSLEKVACATTCDYAQTLLVQLCSSPPSDAVMPWDNTPPQEPGLYGWLPQGGIPTLINVTQALIESGDLELPTFLWYGPIPQPVQE